MRRLPKGTLGHGVFSRLMCMPKNVGGMGAGLDDEAAEGCAVCAQERKGISRSRIAASFLMMVVSYRDGECERSPSGDLRARNRPMQKKPHIKKAWQQNAATLAMIPSRLDLWRHPERRRFSAGAKDLPLTGSMGVRVLAQLVKTRGVGMTHASEMPVLPLYALMRDSETAADLLSRRGAGAMAKGTFVSRKLSISSASMPEHE